MKIFNVILFIIVFVVVFLLCWPTPLEPIAWEPQAIPALEGEFAANTKLNNIKVLYPALCAGCEDVAIDAAGNIYGGTENGDLKKFTSLDDQVGSTLSNTGGRPLGLHLDKMDNLWVCDANRGLLKVKQDGGVFTMATEHGGKRFRFTNDLDIAADGTVYFTDASDKYSFDMYKFDLLEHQPRGRFFSFEPETKTLELISDGLYFANGVALDKEEEFALVCETGTYQVRKIWLQGDKKGQSELILENLPAYPDGISRGSNGIFWLALISPRKAYLEKAYGNTTMAKAISRLPNFLQPAPSKFVNILGINENGKIIHNIQMERPNFSQITSVQEAYGQLFLGSLKDDGIGRIAVPK